MSVKLFFGCRTYVHSTYKPHLFTHMHTHAHDYVTINTALHVSTVMIICISEKRSTMRSFVLLAITVAAVYAAKQISKSLLFSPARPCARLLASMPVRPSGRPAVCRSTRRPRPSVHLPVRSSARPPVRAAARPSICPSARPPVLPAVRPLVHPFPRLFVSVI